MAKIPTKKVKVQVRVCQTFTLCLNLTENMEVSDLDFNFFSTDIAIFCELWFFHYLVGPYFLGGTSKKSHPVHIKLSS